MKISIPNSFLKNLVTLFTILIAFESASQSLQEVYAAGNQAYENEDYVTFLEKMQKADSIRPNHQTILYNLAAGLALNKRKADAVVILRRALWMNASMPFETDSDFDSLDGFEPFSDLIQEINLLKEESSIGEEAFTISNKMMHPEGVAYSSENQQFYLSSVQQRKIISYDDKNGIKDFMTDSSFMSIMGLQVDDKNGLLWVCSTPAPEMQGYEKDLKAEVLSIDIETRKIIGRYAAPKEGDWLGDLIISKSGNVYVSNSSADNPGIYQVDPNSDTLKTLIDATELISIQGLALNADESALFFADYRYGLFKYDLLNDNLVSLGSDINHPLKGTDGLYFHEGSLIAIQNGLRPFRVVRYKLDESETKITDYNFLEKALPQMNEPTLGTIVNNTFYYVVNSPWGAYDREKNFIAEKADKPIIRKLVIPD